MQHWTGLAYEEGPAAGSGPLSATRRLVRLRGDESPSEAVERALVEHRELAGRGGAVAAATAIDPRRWELVHFVLWADGAAARDADGDRFQVLHVSAPHRGELARGRQW
ncbi:DUF4865 family protein [Streptomyces sp. NPDC002133]|uniref:DUF4865 family protein n=1 Tax=Streptomyces sp. NPDC002133 TaxID=3154409 RepID=UPI00331F8D93